MSIDPKLVEFTADVFIYIHVYKMFRTNAWSGPWLNQVRLQAVFSSPRVLLLGELAQAPHYTRNDAVPGGYLHRTWPPGVRSGRHTHAFVYNGIIACAAWVVRGTAGRDSLRYRYHGNCRTRQLTLDCECNWVNLTHDVYENTWKCGELKLYFSPSAGGSTKKSCFTRCQVLVAVFIFGLLKNKAKLRCSRGNLSSTTSDHLTKPQIFPVSAKYRFN